MESGIQLKESEIQLMIGIWNLSSTDKKSAIQYLESGTWNPHCRFLNPRLSWITLDGATPPRLYLTCEEQAKKYKQKNYRKNK